MRIAALAGGVGAAKLLSGLVEVFPAEDLTVVVNTGDDFQWLGLYICPDLDTLTYTLAGLAHPERGWGVRGDTFHALARLQELGCDTWFLLGDCDLATHIYRTAALLRGQSLNDVTHRICLANKIRATLLPMTNSPVPTQVHTDEGILPFQEYFVRRKCEPRVAGFTYSGAERSHAAPGAFEALREAGAILICPSNPFISIAPILAVPGIRETLRNSTAKVIAITPIIAGKSVKGPAATMLEQLGHEVSAVSVARMYQEFLDVFVLDRRDADLEPQIAYLDIEVQVAETLMDTHERKVDLAREVLALI